MRPLYFRNENFSPYILTSVSQEAMLEVRCEVSTTVSTALLLSKVSNQPYFLFTLVVLLSWKCLTAQWRGWFNLASFSKVECWLPVLFWVSISSVWKVNVYYISLNFDLGISVMEFIKSVFLLLLWENFQWTLRMAQSNGITLSRAAFIFISAALQLAADIRSRAGGHTL